MFGNDDAVMAPPKAAPKVVKKSQPSNEPRVRLTKKELLDRFKSSTELDFTIFEKEGLLENADLFHSSGTQGAGKEPENFGVDPEDKSIYNSYKKSAASYNKPGQKPYSKNQSQHSRPNNYEDDNDEPDPEWLDDSATPSTATAEDEDKYFKRVIPNEVTLRESAQRTVKPIALNDEDALDELIQNQLKEEMLTQGDG